MLSKNFALPITALLLNDFIFYIAILHNYFAKHNTVFGTSPSNVSAGMFKLLFLLYHFIQHTSTAVKSQQLPQSHYQHLTFPVFPEGMTLAAAEGVSSTSVYYHLGKHYIHSSIYLVKARHHLLLPETFTCFAKITSRFFTEYY